MDEATITQQYYIATKSAPTDDRARVLKYGSMFAVFDRLGDISNEGLGEQGIFYEGTRYLSEMTLRLWSERPLLLSSTIEPNNFLFTADLTNLDVSRGDSVAIHRGTLHLLRSRFLWQGVAYEELEFVNYGMEQLSVPLTIFFTADFADIFEVRGTLRGDRGHHLKEERSHNTIVLGYEGLDNVTRRMRITCDPPPDRITGPEMRFELELNPTQPRRFHLRMECDNGAAANHLSYPQARTRAFNEMQISAKTFPSIHSSNSRFNDWMNRSFADVQMMTIGNREHNFPYAGVPWFSTVFGRDGIITAMETLWITPWIAQGVLQFLAETQATEVDESHEAEPGKILHELRHGEMANLGEIPFARYYGSVDATPLFVMLAGEYYVRTGDKKLIQQLWPNILAAVRWMDDYGDIDGDGFVEYAPHGNKGLVQQGWKDSNDSVFHANGALAVPPIALCEVQGYVYAAKLAAAHLSSELGDEKTCRELESQASTLRRKFEEAFWCEDLGTYALALDGKKRKGQGVCRVRASNAGHCLFTGIASPEHARKTAETLLQADFFSGWGIRTLATKEARYNPLSYHNGSVWPHDNALIASGFGRYGFRNLAGKIMLALLDVSSVMELHRLPELFCGLERRIGEGPTLYPVACSPQAWAAAAPFLLIQSCLGLRIEGARNRVVFERPCLPEGIPQLSIRGLSVGAASVDLFFERQAENVRVQVLEKRGEVDVIATL
ncbi:MAG TPA: amylo-alpha-1,6-glucosidase [Terriglobales bacterium]|nr:amylo-alpha-1,6-glucosidase [Terriglobales bacterium]